MNFQGKDLTFLVNHQPSLNRGISFIGTITGDDILGRARLLIPNIETEPGYSRELDSVESRPYFTAKPMR